MGTIPSSPSSRCTIAETRSVVAVLTRMGYSTWVYDNGTALGTGLGHQAVDLEAEDSTRAGEFQIVVQKSGDYQTLCAGLLKATLEDPNGLPKEKLKRIFTEILGAALLAPAEVDIAWNEFWIALTAPLTDPFAAQLVSM